jgi:hypothetical protein
VTGNVIGNHVRPSGQRALASNAATPFWPLERISVLVEANSAVNSAMHRLAATRLNAAVISVEKPLSQFRAKLQSVWRDFVVANANITLSFKAKIVSVSFAIVIFISLLQE